MRKRILRKSNVGTILFIPLFLFVGVTHAENVTPLRLVKTIPLPGVMGRIDHMAVDLEDGRLFVAALGNSSLEVLDFHSFKHIRRIGGLSEPQGVLYIPEFGNILVTNGGNGSCKIFDSKSFQLTKALNFSSDADNVRYDPRTKYIYVGYGNGGLGIIDASNWKRIGDIPLSGHPESFQLEGSGSKIFVNVPGANNIAVVDRMKRAVVGTWTVEGAQENFPMVLDESSHHLFIGCRQPPKIIIYDTESGREVTKLDIPGDIDDILYDGMNKRIYASCGEGFLSVFQEKGANEYTPLAKISTARGARTSLFVPEQKRLYLAVPRRDKQQAEIRLYAVEP